MPFLSQNLHLIRVQARKAEHSDLAGDVVPGARRALGLQAGTESLAHLDDATTHCAEVLLPLGEELGVVEHNAGNTGSVGGRVRDL